MKWRASQPARALAGGAVCLAILGGMIVGHAWPLWTGRVVRLRIEPIDPRDLFRGEYVAVTIRAERLFVIDDSADRPDTAAVPVRPAGGWRPDYDTYRRMRGAVIYVQLEPAGGSAAGGEYQAVTASDRPIDGAINLRGRIRWVNGDRHLVVDYGLDAFYMQEGTARSVEDAIAMGKLVQMDVAIAASGRPRIVNLLIDGAPLRR